MSDKASELNEKAEKWSAENDIELSKQERMSRLADINKSLEQARFDIQQGKGIPLNIAAQNMRGKLSKRLKA